MSQIVPTSSHAQNLTGQTVNYFGPVLKGARKHIEIHPCSQAYVLGNLFFYSQLDIYKKSPPLLEKKTSAT